MLLSNCIYRSKATFTTEKNNFPSKVAKDTLFTLQAKSHTLSELDGGTTTSGPSLENRGWMDARPLFQTHEERNVPHEAAVQKLQVLLQYEQSTLKTR